MKIAILGSGAMGSLYGFYLAKVHEVTMVDAWPNAVDAINAKGLVMQENGKELTQGGMRAVLSGTDIGPQDLVIVFVKSTQTYQAVKENLHLFDAHTYALTLQNGAGNNRDIAHFIDPSHIIVGTSSHNSVSQGPGKFFHSGTGPTNIGPDVPTAEADKAVHEVAEALRKAGLEVNEIENIQEILWSKLFVNCAINGLTCVLNCQIGEMKENPWLWEMARKIVYECVLVAEADGTYFDRKDAVDTVWKVVEHDAQGLASMVQDRRHKRVTEVDKINGTVVALAEQYHLDVPYNRMLVKLVHAVETNYPRS